MLGLEYRIKDLESDDKDVSLALSPEQLTDAVSDLGADISRCALELSGQLRLQSSVVQFDGQLQGQLVLPCQRCLEPAHVPIDMRLNTIYTPASSKRDEESAESVDDEDVDYAHHDGETVDLWPILREDLILAVPITVVCKDDCRGLCPTCGVDRNVATCDCQTATPVSPFAGLRSIKLPT